MDKSSVQAKFSANQVTVLWFVVGCSFPLGATTIDLLRHGLPFSLSTVLAVQTTQPLHWLINSIPFLIFFLVQTVRRTKRTSSSRSNAQGETPNTSVAKFTQTVIELKTELAKQRRAEETLRASEEFYRTLVENTNDGIATVSLDGTLTSVNRGFELMLEKSREDMVGKHYSTILPISSLAFIEDRIRRFQSGEKLPSLFEFELLHHKGTVIPIEARVRAISDKDGNPIGFQGIYRDTTKRAALKHNSSSPHTSQQIPEAGVISRPTTGGTENARLPWMQTSSQRESNASAHHPTGYSPLSHHISEPSDVLPADNLKTSAAIFLLAQEPSTFEPSTVAPAMSPSLSISELQSVNSSPPQFRFVTTTNEIPSAYSPSAAPLEQSGALPISSQPPTATDRQRKEDRQAKVVPFPIAATQGSTTPFPPQLGSAASQQMLNLDEALNRVDGDRELLREMASVFLDEYPLLLVTMQDALSHGNAQTLTYAVHTLKGSVANFAATNAFEAALKLEKIGRQGNLTQARSALAELEAELARLVPLLTTLKIEAAA